MVVSVVIANYSTALFEVALKQKASVNAIFAELDLVIRALNSGRKIKKIMFSTYSSYKVKNTFFQSIVQDLGISDIISSFISVLLRNNRMMYLDKIKNNLEDLINQHNGVTKVIVKTASKPSDDLLKFLKNHFESCLKAEVIIKSVIDHKIIGGVMLQIDSKLLDFSVISKLNKIRQLVQVI